MGPRDGIGDGRRVVCNTVGRLVGCADGWEVEGCLEG